MHTDTTPMKRPAGDGNHPAGHTDSAMIPAAGCCCKSSEAKLQALRAKAARHGLGLHQLSNGVLVLFRASSAFGFRSLDRAEEFLRGLGGAA